MEDFYNGHEEGFHRWVDRGIKLCRFRPYIVADYLLRAIRNSTDKSIGIYGFPNFRSWNSILWTLRWCWIQILEGDEFKKGYRSN